MTAPTIHDLATTVGATVTTSTFEGGTHYTLTLPGRGSLMISPEWGDDEAEWVAILHEKMTAAGWFAPRHEFLLDFGGGRTARIWASDAATAQRLAGQGEPETITNLSTGETFEWIAPS